MSTKTYIKTAAAIVIFGILVIGFYGYTMSSRLGKSADAHNATKEQLKTTKEQLKICQTNLATFKNLDEKNISDIETYILENYRRISPVIAKEISAQTVVLASEYGLAVPILVGMMEVESNFGPHALSKRNARGLMQVRWKVWGEMLKDEFGYTNNHELHQIKKGITAGIIVFKYYMAKNDNNISKALYAYVGKDDSYATKVYSAMGRFVLHRVSTMPQVEEPQNDTIGESSS